MSTNLEFRAREKVGGRPAKLNVEKGDRSEILSERQKRRDEKDLFVGRIT